MFFQANILSVTISRRWWWQNTRGKVYPPPDIERSFTWFAPRATGRWRAFFLSQMGAEFALFPEEYGLAPCSCF